MDDIDEVPHLSQIQTHWTMIFQAHDPAEGGANPALCALMERYGGSVHRYLLGITRDPELAADLAQEFALRFLRGDFRRAHPSRGRFRNFVKTAVLNLVVDHHRRLRHRPQSGVDEMPEPATPDTAMDDFDRHFVECWRDELLQHAWAELALIERRTGQPYYSVLRFRTAHPKSHSPEMAEGLSIELGRPVNAGWVRQTLLRSREKFVSLIIAEVSRSLEYPTEVKVDEELMNLGLWDYCRSGRKK